MKYKVFIDGKEGTTGLKIFERLETRADLQVLKLKDELRKDVAARKEMINSADVVFLCLPDAAAIEAVSLCENQSVKIIDASTAHRTAMGWAYGFPELSVEHKKRIREGNRIAVPGCHASGFISLVYPLIAGGFVSQDYPFSCHSITGYSGGGKKMIAEYETESRGREYDSPRRYALGQQHKHLPEMMKICGLQFAPVFDPIVADYYNGMCVTIPLHTRLMDKKCTVLQLKEYYTKYYASHNFVKIDQDEPRFLAANPYAGTNEMHIIVSGNEERIILSSVFDNLGKGASGAAVQCMNIALGMDECASLK